MTNSRLLLIDGATDVRLAGHGVIDGRGSIVRDQGKPANLLRICNSSLVTVEGVTLGVERVRFRKLIFHA